MARHAQLEKLINRTFDETLALLEEVREYSMYDGAKETEDLPNTDRLWINQERLRLTARLSEIMAWLLVHKAVAAGEITADKAHTEKFRLSAQAICMKDGRTGNLEWPPRLNGFLEKSRELYDRVSKMDQMTARLIGGTP